MDTSTDIAPWVLREEGFCQRYQSERDALSQAFAPDATVTFEPRS